MRKPFIAGNWKMNMDRQSSVALARDVVLGSKDRKNVDLAMCPPSVYLDAVGQILAGSHVGLGAQNVYFEESGAFTGEISGAMLADLHCQYVIIGHSERRLILGETDDMVLRKAKAALQHPLTPIVCVGETLEQREAGLTSQVIESQFAGSLAGLAEGQIRRTVLAYEPVWAIGTGRVATPEQAQEVHAALRKMLRNTYNQTTADQVRILYGGSVKPSNAGELMSCPDIDGALVGGASLAADSFLGIVEAARG